MSQPAASPPVASPATPSGHSASWAGANGAGPAVWVKTILPRSIASIASILSLNSEEWKARINALQELEKIIVDCKEYERSAAGTTMATSFPVTLGALLFSLAPALATQVSDLRSEIVRQASHTISALATQLGDQLQPSGDGVSPGPFHKCGVKILPSVLTMASSSNSVMRGYALTAAQDLVGHVMNSQNVLGHLFNEIKHTKNKNLKALSMELIAETVLKKWPRKLWGGGGAASNADMTPRSSGAGGAGSGSGAAPAISHLMLEEHLLLGLASADTLTRSNAARAVWHYARFGSLSRAQAMVKAMEPRTRKIVLDAVTPEDKGTSLEENAGAASEDTPTAAAAAAAARSRSNSLASASSTGGGAGRKTPTNAAARTPSFGAVNGTAGTTEDDGAGTSASSMRPLNLSSTSISDGILTKALSEARRKLSVPTPGTAAGAAPAATTTATSANHTTASGLGGQGAKRVGTTATGAAAGTAGAATAAAPSAAATGLKKPSALGAASRVLVKKPPAAATAAGPSAAPAASGLKAPAARVSALAAAPPAPSAAAAASGLEADGDAEVAALSQGGDPLSRPSHARTISTFRLDDLQGLLNDRELTEGSSPQAPGEGAENGGATVAASATSAPSAAAASSSTPLVSAADGSSHPVEPLSSLDDPDPALSIEAIEAAASPGSRHLRSLSIQSNTQHDAIVTEPVFATTAPAGALASIPASAAAAALSTPVKSSSAAATSMSSSGRRTPGAPVTKTATPGAVNTPATNKRPASAAVAAAAILRQQQAAAHSASKLPLKPTPSTADAKKRSSLPPSSSSGASTARGSATTTNTPAGARRSLLSSSSSGASVSRPQSRSASKIRPPGSISASVSGRTSPTGSEYSLRSPTTPRGGGGTATPKRSSSARRPPPISASAAQAAGRKTPTPKTPVPTTPRSGRGVGARPVTPTASRKKAAPTNAGSTTNAKRTAAGMGGSGNRTPGKSPARFLASKPLSLSALANAFGSPLASPLPPIDVQALAQSMRGLGSSGAGAGAALASPSSARSLSSPGGGSAFSSAGIAHATGDLALLLKDHRAHLSDSSHHLQSLNAHYVAVSAALSSLGPSIVPQGGLYLDNMISLLSESLAKTTRILEAFMALKRIEIATQQAKQKEQSMAVQAALAALQSPTAATSSSEAAAASNATPAASPTTTAEQPTPTPAQFTSDAPAGTATAAPAATTSMHFPLLSSDPSFPPPTLSATASTESASSSTSTTADQSLFPPHSPGLASSSSASAPPSALQADAPHSLDELLDMDLTTLNDDVLSKDATSAAAPIAAPLSPSSRMHVLAAVQTSGAVSSSEQPRPASPNAVLHDPPVAASLLSDTAVAPAANAADVQAPSAAPASSSDVAAVAPTAPVVAAAPAASAVPFSSGSSASAFSPPPPATSNVVRPGSVAAMLAKFGHNSSATSSRDNSRTVSREPSPPRVAAANTTTTTISPPKAKDLDEY